MNVWREWCPFWLQRGKGWRFWSRSLWSRCTSSFRLHPDSITSVPNEGCQVFVFTCLLHLSLSKLDYREVRVSRLSFIKGRLQLYGLFCDSLFLRHSFSPRAYFAFRARFTLNKLESTSKSDSLENFHNLIPQNEGPWILPGFTYSPKNARDCQLLLLFWWLTCRLKDSNFLYYLRNSFRWLCRLGRVLFWLYLGAEWSLFVFFSEQIRYLLGWIWFAR